MGFAEWIAAVVQWRRSAEAFSAARGRQAAVRAGLQESSRAGVTTLADVITFPWPDDAYGDALSGVVALAEYLAPTEPRASEQWGMLRQFLAGQSSITLGRRWGLSPHAPYTVRWEMLPHLCELSAARQIPVAMHLAESRDELEFLRTGSGPLRDLLQALGAWDAAAVPRGRSPRDYLEVLSTSHRALIVHGNYLDSEEIRFTAARRDRMAVVYCPRTHGYFAHSRYPLAEMLSAGVHVALGTDSRASNADLQLLEEMRYVGKNTLKLRPR